jgi:hypothetical protein
VARSFEDLLSVGDRVLNDPDLASPERVAQFKRVVAGVVEVARERGIIRPYDIADKQGRWLLRLRKYEGATPDQIVEEADAITHTMLQSVPSEVSEGDDDAGGLMLPGENQDYFQRWSLRARDSLLVDMADQSVKEGDFAAVGTYVNGIGNESTRKRCLRDCIGHARTPDDANVIRPDAMTLEFDPDLAAEFERADVLASGDPDVIQARALEYARTITEGDAQMKNSFISAAHKALIAYDKRQAEAGVTEAQPRATAYLREAVSALRETGRRYNTYEFLSYDLITAGDPDEPQHAYEDILQDYRPGEGVLHGLLRLRSFINEARHHRQQPPQET